MPAQMGQSEFLSKMGAQVNAAFDKHKNDELKAVGGGQLPAGVEGIARLVSVKLGKVEQGKEMAGSWYINAQAVVVTPEYFTDSRNNRIKTAGKRTSFMEMLCDTTPKPGAERYQGARYTIEDHVAHVMQLLRRLGCKTEVVPAGQGALFIEKFVADLNARTKPPAKPLFVEFRTFTITDKKAPAPKPGEAVKEPKVFEVWGNAVAHEQTVSADAAFVDHTNRKVATNGATTAAPTNRLPASSVVREAASEPEADTSVDPSSLEGQYDESMSVPVDESPESSSPSPALDDTTDLDSMAELADGGTRTRRRR